MTRDAIQSQLWEFIRRDLLKKPTFQVKEDEPLITGGVLSSYFLVQIALFIEDSFGVHLEDDELTPETMDTLAMMTDRILRATP